MKLQIEITLGLDITDKRLKKLGFKKKNFVHSHESKTVWTIGSHMGDSGHFGDTIVYDPERKRIEANYGGSVYMPSISKANSMTDIKRFLKDHPHSDDKREHQENFGEYGNGFEVVLKHYGLAKIGCMKVIKDHMKLSLNETKILVNAVPVSVAKNVCKDEAESLKKKLEDIGAEVELK